MYPNPQDVLPLPSRPDVGHYRKRAKALLKAFRAGDDALLTAVRSWTDSVRRAEQVVRFALEQISVDKAALSQAQFVVARAHGFPSWPAFVHHLEGLAQSASGISTFEQAAEAICDGDLAMLERLLRVEPALVHARSTREHRASLLHYVAANGVENYRQRTPANIVAIARRLLDAGAEVDAEADVYGGGATTLGLVVTSAHPRAAGVQLALADLLIVRGARIGARAVRDCLANGCPEAAAHMAQRGAPVGLEEAAGIGRIDLIERYFEPARAATAAEIAAAMMMAAWYDRRDVIGFLLDHGVDVSTRDAHEGRTALHIAAYQGNVALIEFLLARGAAPGLTDTAYGTTPLVWAQHAWRVDHRGPDEAYRQVITLLGGDPSSTDGPDAQSTE